MRKEGESTTTRINRQKFRLAFDNASYEGKDIGVSKMRCKKKKEREDKQKKDKKSRIEHKQLLLKHNLVVSD